MKGTVMSRNDGEPQLRAITGRRFTAEARQSFLDALALTGNSRLAARHAGVDVTTPYRHRSRDPVFRHQWRVAVKQGYDRLEELVLLHGGAGQAMMDADPFRAEAEAEARGEPFPPFDFDRALAVLRQYRWRGEAIVEQPMTKGRLATPEQTDAALEKALLAAERRMRKAAERQVETDRP